MGRQPDDAQHHAQGMQTSQVHSFHLNNGYLHIGHARHLATSARQKWVWRVTCASMTPTGEKNRNTSIASRRGEDGWATKPAWLSSPVAPSTLSRTNTSPATTLTSCTVAEYLIIARLAYVDEQTPEQMRAARRTSTRNDQPVPYPQPDENLARSPDAEPGELVDGAAILRAKIDMANPNINPARPCALPHPSGDAPPQPGRQMVHLSMYTFAHPIEDALEDHHSIATLGSKTRDRSTTGCFTVWQKAG